VGCERTAINKAEHRNGRARALGEGRSAHAASKSLARRASIGNRERGRTDENRQLDLPRQLARDASGQAISNLDAAAPGWDKGLETAVVLGDAERIKRELAVDPDLASRRDPRTGWTALHAVCASRWHLDPARAKGLLAVARLLLDAGADPNERQPYGETPVMFAARNGNVDAIKVLIDRKADVNAKETVRGTTALMWAAEQGHPAAVGMLIEHGADVGAVSNPELGQPFRTPKATKSLRGSNIRCPSSLDQRSRLRRAAMA